MFGFDSFCIKSISKKLVFKFTLIGVLAYLAVFLFIQQSRSYQIISSKTSVVEGAENQTIDDFKTQAKRKARLAKRKLVELVSYKIKAGDCLGTIWSNFSSVPKGAMLAADAFKAAEIAPNSLKVGEEIHLQVSKKKNDITGLKRSLEDGSKVILDGNSYSGYKVTLIEPRIEENTKTLTGTIYNSFSDSASRAGADYKLIDDYADLFSGRIIFNRDIQVGDKFSIIYNEKIVNNGEQINAGPIIAAALVTGGKTYAALGHQDKNGKTHFYDEKGEVLGKYFLRYPLQFTRISSMFSHSRFHPLLKIRRPHNGVDFAAPTGTPVRTVADGVVTEAGRRGGNGIMVKIKHTDRYSTAYLHLSKITPGIRKGVRVTRGQLIGAVGSTGYSTGPHLHFSFYDLGRYVDPMGMKLPTMPSTNEKIPDAKLRALIKELNTSLNSVTLAMNRSITMSLS